MRADRIALLLPEVYRRTIVEGTPLADCSGSWRTCTPPSRRCSRDLPRYFDPQRTPDRFVPFLAHWVDLDRWLDEAPATSTAAPADCGRSSPGRRGSPGRGAPRAVSSMPWSGRSGLRACASRRPPTRPRPAPPVPHGHHLSRRGRGLERLARRIVEQEKPAHVTADVRFEGAQAKAGEPAGPQAGPVEEVDTPTLPLEPLPPQPTFPGTEPGVVVAPGPAAPPDAIRAAR